MRVVIAIDSFKGSLTSIEAGNAVSEGIKKVYKDAECIVRPIADGGEGTVDTLVLGMNGERKTIKVTGPLGEVVEGDYGIIKETKTAIIEMSAAAGITLVPLDKRNPLETTTYGVGEIIKDAIGEGCRNFIIGIGGSATNDGGMGMLAALGFEFLDKDAKPVSLGAKGLDDICTITNANVIKELSECNFKVACDVTNPLCGKLGCSAVYGPQKGADEKMIERMDKALEKYALLSKEINPDADAKYPGTGAAGGLGFAFVAFLSAELKNGIQLILNESKLEEYIEDADVVITGEGRLDSQTAMGKAPGGVAEIAKKYNKPVIAFSGCVAKDAGVCNNCGIDAFFPALRNVCTLDEAMDKANAYENLASTAEQVFRLWKVKK